MVYEPGRKSIQFWFRFSKWGISKSCKIMTILMDSMISEGFRSLEWIIPSFQDYHESLHLKDCHYFAWYWNASFWKPKSKLNTFTPCYEQDYLPSMLARMVEWRTLNTSVVEDRMFESSIPHSSNFEAGGFLSGERKLFSWRSDSLLKEEVPLQKFL